MKKNSHNPEEMEELVERAKNGDDDAFNELLKRFKPIIYKHMSGLYSKLMGSDGDDIYQEGVIAMYNAVQRYNKEKSAFPTYLYNSVMYHYKRLITNEHLHKNRLLNYSLSLDKEKTIGKNGDGETDMYGLVEEKKAVHPEDFLEMIDIKKALVYLNEQEKEIINMRFLQDMTMVEIGEKLGVIKQRIDQVEKSAIQKIRAVMENENLDVLISNHHEKHFDILYYCSLSKDREKAFEEVKNLKDFSHKMGRRKKDGLISYGRKHGSRQNAVLTKKGKKMLRVLLKGKGYNESEIKEILNNAPVVERDLKEKAC